MKFLDLLKLSLHSIYYNKIRTFITVIIVFVVSLLIMVISIIGLSFLESIDSAYVAMYDKTGATFQLESYYKNSDNNDENVWRNISEEEYVAVMDQFKVYPELVDNVILSANLESYYLYDLDSKPTKTELDDIFTSHEFYSKYQNSRPESTIISSWGDLDTKSKGISYIKSGKHWNKEDEGEKKVWVSEAFIAQAASYGVYLDVNDYIVVCFVSYTYTNNEHTQVRGAERLKISGIFLNSALKELNNERDLFIDVMTAYSAMGENINLNSVQVINEPKISYVFDNEYKKMSTIVKKLNATIEPSSYNNRTQERFRCDLVENLKMVRIIGFVMIGAAVFICFIILIISIGSVANSVIISVDKNKRFLGVMMAVGLRNSGVKRIVQFEALLMIIIATGLAYGILRFFQQYFLPIIDFLMTMPGFTDSSIVVMPIYVPVITVLAFIFMALMFARKSLSKIINMDVISVISEVA